MRPQHNRGDKTPLELFITGVQGWEAGLRKSENGKSRQGKQLLLRFTREIDDWGG
jgi:hypothetical protein